MLHKSQTHTFTRIVTPTSHTFPCLVSIAHMLTPTYAHTPTHAHTFPRPHTHTYPTVLGVSPDLGRDLRLVWVGSRSFRVLYHVTSTTMI